MPGLTRPLAAGSLALWFLVGGIGDAPGAHSCPHHDGLPVPAHADPASHPDHGVPSDSHGPCTCVGRCHAGAAPSLTLPAARQAALVAPPAL